MKEQKQREEVLGKPSGASEAEKGKLGDWVASSRHTGEDIDGGQ